MIGWKGLLHVLVHKKGDPIVMNGPGKYMHRTKEGKKCWSTALRRGLGRGETFFFPGARDERIRQREKKRVLVIQTAQKNIRLCHTAC